VIETDGGGDDGVGGGEDGDEVQPIEDDAVADGQTLVPADIRDAGRRREIMPLAAVVAHGEAVVVAFHEDADDGGDPADDGYKRENEDTDDVYRLPEGVAEGEADAASDVEEELPPIQDKLVAAAADQGFGLLAEVGEEGGADNEKKIFEEGEVEEDLYEMDHEAAHDEQEAERGALAVMEETIDARYVAKPADGGGGGDGEVVHADAKEDRIKHARDEDPLPQVMFGDEVIGFYIRLEGYDNFFEQRLFSFICSTVKPTYL